MSYGSLWERLVRGVRWSWVDPRYQAALPPDLDASVMTLESRDRLHDTPIRLDPSETVGTALNLLPKRAHGAVVVQYGDTVTLVTAIEGAPAAAAGGSGASSV